MHRFANTRLVIADPWARWGRVRADVKVALRAHRRVPQNREIHRMTKRSIRAMSMLAAMALISAASVQAQKRYDFDSTPGNLSKQVVPSRYALHLDLDPARDGFT